jgi:hypothetical protein
MMKADIDDIIRQAKIVLSLRDETGGIPATIDNTSALQALSMYIQWHETGKIALAKQLQGSLVPSRWLRLSAEDNQKVRRELQSFGESDFAIEVAD